MFLFFFLEINERICIFGVSATPPYFLKKELSDTFEYNIKTQKQVRVLNGQKVVRDTKMAPPGFVRLSGKQNKQT